VKSVGKSFGMKIVWYVALPAQAARAQAADEENEKLNIRGYENMTKICCPYCSCCEVDKYVTGLNVCRKCGRSWRSNSPRKEH
jgi:ribosomal protein L37AE/L43A